MKKIILIMMLASCGPQNNSELKYISWSNSGVRSSTISSSINEEIRVCIKGTANNADKERAFTWTAKGLLTWLKAIKKIDRRVTSSIAFTCSKPNLNITLRQGNGTSFASPSKTTIYLARPYGTWVHEFGHAFAGLGDTYSGRRAGNCKSGQPESLMCWGAYGPRKDETKNSLLWEDDIKGVQANYRKIFGNDLTPPEFADTLDLYAPIDHTSPWPRFFPTIVHIDDQVTRIIGTDPTKIDYSENIQGE